MGIPIVSLKNRRNDFFKRFIKRRGCFELAAFTLAFIFIMWIYAGVDTSGLFSASDSKTLWLRATWYSNGLEIDNETGEPKRPPRLMWVPPLAQPKTDEELRNNFTTILTLQERSTLLETFKVLVKLLKQLKHPPILFDGSLLGYYRHNSSFIPWDDDIDIIVMETAPSRQFSAELARKLNELGAKEGPFRAYNSVGHNVVKFFMTNGTVPVIEHGRDDLLRWPYVDLFIMSAFSLQSDQHPEAFDESHQEPSVFFKWKDDPFLYPFEVMFPLQEVTFESVTLYAPRNIRAVLELTYNDLDNCSTQIFSHRTNNLRPQLSKVNCSLIANKGQRIS